MAKRVVKVKRRREKREVDLRLGSKRKKKRYEFEPNFFDFLDPPEYDQQHYPVTGWSQRDMLSEKDVFRPKFPAEKMEFKGKAIRRMWAVRGVTKMGIPFIMLTPLRGDTARVFNNAMCGNQCDPSTATQCAVVPDKQEEDE